MDMLTVTVPSGTRSCGGCTACCKTHALEETPFRKSAGKWCIYCDVGKGCGVYSRRPEECQTFSCMWLKGNGEGDDRPDISGVVCDYVVLPDGLPGGVLQLFEYIPGALKRSRITELRARALLIGMWVTTIPVSGKNKRLYAPPGADLSPEVQKSAQDAHLTLVVHPSL